MNYPNLPYNAVLFRYSEIGIKGRNRRHFENALMQRLQYVLADFTAFRILRERGRIAIVPADEGTVFNATDLGMLRVGVPRVFGLASASPCFRTDSTLDAMSRVIDDTFPQVVTHYEQAFPSGHQIRYAMRTRKNNRAFPMSSNDVEIHFAERLLPQHPRLMIDLTHPDLKIQVEIRKKHTFITYEEIAGPGGLPTGTSGHVLAMLSGGIDSPVACYQVMRRGCTVDYLTFHSSPYTPPGTLRKVARLAAPLSTYQGTGGLFAVNLLEAQKTIRETCTERFRTILYRRLMLRVAQRLAHDRSAKAVVTGENLGQVASQTLQNLTVIEAAADVTVLRPLLAFDKQDIVSIARQLDLLDISNEPMPDSCTVFAPDNPATNAPLQRIIQEESKFDVDALVQLSLGTCVSVDLASYTETPVQISFA